MLGAVVILAALATGCTGGTSPSTDSMPDGKTELAKSADAMRSVQNTHFTIKVDVDLLSLPVQNAEGDLTSSGAAKGNAKVNEFGQPVQLEFMLTDGSAYIKVHTGGYQKMSARMLSASYDPATLLNPDKGVVKVLSNVQNPQTEEKENDAYRMAGTVTKAVVSALTPGIASNVNGKFWVSSTGQPYLKQATFEVPNGHGTATVTVVLSGINAPVTVTPRRKRGESEARDQCRSIGGPAHRARRLRCSRRSHRRGA
jgi:lipoprotein LprG